MSEGATVIKVHCNGCVQATNHAVLRTFAIEGELYSDAYEIVRCLGCEFVSFAQRAWGHEFEKTVRYPSSEHRVGLVEFIFGLPDKVGAIYQETICAFNVEAPMLAAIGLRAVVEAVCLDQGCTGSRLVDRIDELASKGAITKNNAALLHAHRLLGNEAAHGIEAPSPEELNSGLTAVEIILSSIYLVPGHLDGMKAGRAVRTGTP